MLDEPPGADPHAGWCGDWGLKTPGYPIIRNFNRPHLMQQQYICAFLERTLPQIQRLPHRNLRVLNTLPTAQNS